MPIATFIVIVRPEHLVPVKKRLSATDVVIVISEAELLQIQDTIVSRPPQVIVMHSAFAATSRGAMLIAAMKTASGDAATAVRVFIEDDVKVPLLLSDTSPPNDALLETSRPLDRAGTRQAARYPMKRRVVSVNGDFAELIDLSVSGAQIQAPTRLRPLKVTRLVIPEGDIHMQGTVAWAIAVPASGAIQYRAGIEFVIADKKRLAAFCAKHGGAPDPTTGTP